MLVDSPKKDMLWAGSEALGLEDDNSNQVVYLCPGEIPFKSHIHDSCIVLKGLHIFYVAVFGCSFLPSSPLDD